MVVPESQRQSERPHHASVGVAEKNLQLEINPSGAAGTALILVLPHYPAVVQDDDAPLVRIENHETMEALAQQPARRGILLAHCLQQPLRVGPDVEDVVDLQGLAEAPAFFFQGVPEGLALQ